MTKPHSCLGLVTDGKSRKPVCRMPDNRSTPFPWTPASLKEPSPIFDRLQKLMRGQPKQLTRLDLYVATAPSSRWLARTFMWTMLGPGREGTVFVCLAGTDALERVCLPFGCHGHSLERVLLKFGWHMDTVLSGCSTARVPTICLAWTQC